ncbi:MAG: hypothetical protein Q7K42_03145, partial [Candidatus Diapherotrites archaeon]|nr:hypothetical protein [Candidatus Diapherotrites archaeon]
MIINEKLADEKVLDKKTLVEEAGKAILALKEKRLNNMCITQDKTAFIIESAETGKEKYELTAPKDLRVHRGKLQCTEFSVSSEDVIEELQFSITDEKELLKDNALNSIQIKENEKGVNASGQLLISSLNQNSGGEPIPKFGKTDLPTKTKTAEGKFEKTFLACAQGSDAVNKANKKWFILESKNLDSEFFKPKTIAVKTSACFTNPYNGFKEFVYEIQKEEVKKQIDDKDFGNSYSVYAAFDWKDAPEDLKLQEILRKVMEKDGSPKGFQLKGVTETTTQGQKSFLVNIADEKAVEEFINSGNAKAILPYFGACAGVAGFGGAITGAGIGALWDVAFSCGIPALQMLSEYNQTAKSINDATLGKVASFLESIGVYVGKLGVENFTLGNAVSGTVGGVDYVADSALGQFGLTKEQQDVFELGTASEALAQGAGDLFLGQRLTQGKVTGKYGLPIDIEEFTRGKIKGAGISYDIADKFTKTVVDSTFGTGAVGTDVELFKSKLREAMQERAEKALLDKFEKQGITSSLTGGTRIRSELIKDAINAATQNQDELMTAVWEKIFAEEAKSSPTYKALITRLYGTVPATGAAPPLAGTFAATQAKFREAMNKVFDDETTALFKTIPKEKYAVNITLEEWETATTATGTTPT